ncbi:haloacid dehalogenase-like hydrolase, putative [gamma proteobacterium HTCC5015]|nr:haloacid dehalogenase-like hydrolase, putative [gamma proteobacterium HTCC5015]
MSILMLPKAHPEVVLIDWHATLVDTHDAMYHAVDEVLPKLVELDLFDRLLHPEDSKTIEDAKLLTYVRDNNRLHPKVVQQRKISRTDIFEVLFGDDEGAKRLAHKAFDESYRNYVGEVQPLESDTFEQLSAVRDLGIQLGVITNRNHEFMLHELDKVEEGRWHVLFDTIVSGNHVERRKPAPDLLLEALRRLGHPADETVWYVGDSTTDVIAAKEAGVEAIFYNGAQWNQDWIDKIFPGTPKHPHRPDAVIASMADLHQLARWVLAQELRVERARS